LSQISGKPKYRVAVLWSVVAVLGGLMLAGCASTYRTDLPSSPVPSSPVPGQPVPGQPVPGQPVPAWALQRLTALADQAVKENGGRPPAWATAVVTTHEKALTSATPGDTVPIGQKVIVYLVTIKGHFVLGAASIPSGSHAPTGTYMSLVIEAKTFQGLDFGLSPEPSPVAPASLGPLTYLKVS
jgi:hypothetical protein